MNWLPGRVYRFSPKVGNNKWVMATSTHTSASNSFDLLTLCTISTSHRFRLAFEKFLQELTQIFIKLIAVRFFKCARHTLNKRAKCFRAQVQLKRAYKLIYSGSSSSYTIAKVVSLYVHTTATYYYELLITINLIQRNLRSKTILIIVLSANAIFGQFAICFAKLVTRLWKFGLIKRKVFAKLKTPRSRKVWHISEPLLYTEWPATPLAATQPAALSVAINTAQLEKLSAGAIATRPPLPLLTFFIF